MRKCLFYIISALFVVLFAGCDKEKEDVIGYIDFGEGGLPPWDVYFFVNNAAGDNLFDPDFDGNILDRQITVTHNGKTYRMNETSADAGYSLRTERRGRLYEPDSYYIALRFGEFYKELRSKGYHNETFTIDWGDGTTDQVRFDSYISFTEDKKGIYVEVNGVETPATIVQKLWLNGELKSKNSLTVIMVK